VVEEAMIKLLLAVVKLWFKLAAMLAGVVVGGLAGLADGVLVGEALTRAEQVTGGQGRGEPPAAAKARNSARGREHGRARSQG
jgi:hypothetical protein